LKTAIYIEDGVVQLVLTPEGEYEQEIIKSFGKKLGAVKVFQGSFYDCRGGWVRQTAHRERGYLHYTDGDCHDASLILRVSEAPPPPELVSSEPSP
jgi:hypothetical protein